MLEPERRNRADVIIAGAIVLAVVIAGTLIWLRSDARGTTSITATSTPPVPSPATTIPVRLSEAWSAESAQTGHPLSVGATVVTADDGTVTGHDPSTGAQLWRYQRDMPLCGAVTAWGSVVAVYRDRRGCSQVTELDGSTGQRAASRNSDADEAVRLDSDGTYVLSSGSSRLELWRSDLVRTVEYGRVDAPVNPRAQPRTGCVHTSAASSGTRLWVLERCPGEETDRLSVQNPVPKDAQKPEEYGSAVLADLLPGIAGARILAASGERVAVYLPGDGGATKPRIGLFDATARAIEQYPLSAPLRDDATVARVGNGYTVWSGGTLLALDTGTLAPTWVIEGTLGPGALLAGRLVVPVADGMAVLDPATGNRTGSIAIPRPAGTAGPITTGVIGNTVLEQRGDRLVALRP